jgi:hypothetical protein
MSASNRPFHNGSAQVFCAISQEPMNLGKNRVRPRRKAVEVGSISRTNGWFNFAEWCVQTFLIEDHLHRPHLRVVIMVLRICRETQENDHDQEAQTHSDRRCCGVEYRGTTAAMAQSAWTTGTASNRAAAGYQTPYNY